MKTHDFYYDLPKELIAQTPLDQRDSSRLLVVDPASEVLEDCHFTEITRFIKPGDCLVLNDSRVLPARLIGTREGTGATIELVLLRDLGNDRWECLSRPGRRTKIGTRILFGKGKLIGEVVDIVEEGNRIIQFSYSGIFLEVLSELGKMPLPPYITETLEDQERYQTVYSKNLGSAAAPTAGLHFTHELLQTLENNGVHICYLTLHVGLGTFRPVKAENIQDHQMHSEFCIVPEETANIINTCRKEGHHIFAAGTTSCRTLESMTDENGILHAGSRWTNIFIYPGYHFKMVEGLITNFHLPESTLIMLVSALAGKDRIMSAYAHAVAERYRFFSFGDAMLILPSSSKSDKT